MKHPVVIIGLGEMGGVFSKAFWRLGYTVSPIVRGMDIDKEAGILPEPEIVLLSVAEKDLVACLDTVPLAWRPKLVLLQNELLPKVWQEKGISDPTVISVWFEKKKGTDVTVLLPSPIYGPKTEIIVSALAGLAIPCTPLNSATELEEALVMKNTFVLTINSAGLKVETTTGRLWQEHRDLALAIANEVVTLQEKLIGRPLDRQSLLERLGPAMLADPHHKCKGRAAPDRLRRALQQAAAFDLALPQLEQIQQEPL